jgi:hypothetical protein
VTLLLSSATQRAFAEVGSCARYKINILLANSTLLDGYIHFVDYGSVETFNEEQLLNRLKGKATSGNIKLYSRIQTINYPQGNKHYEFKYSAATPSDKIIIDINQISRIRILKIAQCESGKFKANDFNIKFTTQIIDDLTQKEIDYLQEKPVSLLKFNVPDTYDSVFCLNYDKSMSNNKFTSLCNQYLKGKDKRIYEQSKSILRDSNIVSLYLAGQD